MAWGCGEGVCGGAQGAYSLCCGTRTHQGGRTASLHPPGHPPTPTPYPDPPTRGNAGDHEPVAQRDGPVLRQVLPGLQHRHPGVAALVPAATGNTHARTRTEPIRQPASWQLHPSTHSHTHSQQQANRGGGAAGPQHHVPDALAQHVEQHLLGAEARLGALRVGGVGHRVAAAEAGGAVARVSPAAQAVHTRQRRAGGASSGQDSTGGGGRPTHAATHVSNALCSSEPMACTIALRRQ